MPDMRPLIWHDDRVVYGIRTRAHFFDPELVDKRPAIGRLLPVLQTAQPAILMTESDAGNKNIVFGDLIAQPDVLLSHGQGLISLEYKSNSGRGHERDKWPRQVRLSSMLQTLVAAMVVAGAKGKPTAALLRCHNVLYLLDPSEEILGILASSVAAAKAYWQEERRVNATQMAQFCEPLIRKRFETADEEGSAAGRKRHEHMLAR